jgi:flagellar P-ring protein precursor FlgI
MRRARSLSIALACKRTGKLLAAAAAGLLFIALTLCLVAASASAARIKDIAILRGARDSQLVGYGLVVGLSGTGDTFRNTPFTQQAVQGMLQNLGMDVHGIELRNRNVAAVIVTADLSEGIEMGSRVDVTVSALGDAPSLMGGTLLLTQLLGSDNAVYATAQGAVAVTGFASQGQGETLSQGVPTAGRIPNGAIVQKTIESAPGQLRSMLELKNPDYATAVRIVDAINAYAHGRFGVRAAYEVDSRTVELFHPRSVTFARFMAEIGELQVQPDMAARVVLDARTGTVVVGQDVQISTVAVTYGTLTVRVNEQPQVSQPNPFSNGRTVVTPNTTINAEQSGGPIAILAGSSLRALVNGLNRIGVKPPGIIAILQAIKTAGALQADLVIQ